jgi:hypothetical protein
MLPVFGRQVDAEPPNPLLSRVRAAPMGKWLGASSGRSRYVGWMVFRQQLTEEINMLHVAPEKRRGLMVDGESVH